MNRRRLSLPSFLGGIEQVHRDVQVCEFELKTGSRLGLKSGRTVQEQGAFPRTSDLSVTNLGQGFSGNITPMVRSARSLPSSCSVQQKVRGNWCDKLS